MYKKTIVYKDFEGNDRVEDAYFNLTKTELIDFALDLPDNVSDSIKDKPEQMDEKQAITKIFGAFGSKGILNFIKELVLRSYGIKREEGRRFEKSEQIRIEFSQTMAFESIMDEFMKDDIGAAEFVNAIIPSDVADGMPNVQSLRQKLPTNN
jgi:hypothetical protein